MSRIWSAESLGGGLSFELTAMTLWHHILGDKTSYAGEVSIQWHVYAYMLLLGCFVQKTMLCLGGRQVEQNQSGYDL